MRRFLTFALLLFLAAIASTLIHEFGHCLSYWAQGVPAGMSLVKEFPLRDITAREYALGTLGGPIASAALLVFSVFLYGRPGRPPEQRRILSALVLASVLYFILRGLIAVMKQRGGELTEIGGLVGLGYLPVVLVYAVLGIGGLCYWMKVGRVRPGVRTTGAFVGLLVGYLIVLVSLESLDQRLFWHRFPTVQIDDGRTYNEPP
ncbi:MAG: hypothetical protein ACYTG2_15840 [Planctomycetota bacterium]|jgi:hypothetical protein